jgi:L-histidine N-alpha-methyltransferase
MTDILQIDEKFTLRNYLSDIDQNEVVRNIIRGLIAPQKCISSIFFYDAAGSKLFEEITRLPEYYPTRTEKKLLLRLAPLLEKKSNPLNIIEIGSGDCSKISILLGALPPQRWRTTRYVPMDASPDAIRESAVKLQDRFPGLEIEGIVADFTHQLHHVPPGKNRLFCFLGSTIGNLSQEQNRQFFLDLGQIMLSGDSLLLGVDLIKPADILEKAYNDGQGVTAAFNRNILKVVNRLVGTNFDPEAFGHLAFFNPDENRIEMHLKAEKDMRVTCPALPEDILIGEEETIHTENSHKYAQADIQALASTVGLEIQDSFTDENNWFSLIHLVKKQ